MDLIFNCPKCRQQLEVDAAGAGQEIDCPACGEKIRIPEPDSPTGGDGVKLAAQPVNPIAASAAAKMEKRLTVPVHDKPAEKLIAKPAVPLEVAAKTSDKQLRIKSIKHSDCVDSGQDKFDATVTAFLAKIGEANLVSIDTIGYSNIDVASQKLLADYGVLIVYKG